jgi:hypothetical protein
MWNCRSYVVSSKNPYRSNDPDRPYTLHMELNRWKVFLDLQLERRMKGQNWQLVITLDNLFRFYCEIKDKNPIHRFAMHSKQFK